MPIVLPAWAIIYIWGVAGSVGVELVAAAKAAADEHGAVPQVYKSLFYVGARISVALVAAGPLAVAFQAANPYSALYIGASAPIIFDRLQRGLSH